MIRFLLSRVLGEHRWTQADLARATDISASQIWEWYHGYAERIPVYQMNRICIALDCQPADLFDFVPDNSEEAKNYRKAQPNKVVIEK